MKISILGNSASLIMRPPRQKNDEKTYVEILEKEMKYNVCHAGKRGAIISDAYNYLEDEVIRFYPDVVIIHFGIVEAVPRLRNRFIYMHSNRNEYKNSIFLSKYKLNIYEQFFDYGLVAVSKVFEAIRKIIGKYIYWLSPEDYSYVLEEYILEIKKELGAKIILIGLGKAGEVIEKKCPGTDANILKYNEVMKKQSKKFPNVYFLDLYNDDKFIGCIPDGSHFNNKGHRMIANKIKLLLGEDI